jgi:uncharacterized membrane protein YeaQ/YmgE (transglycosylase-associated protein family)
MTPRRRAAVSILWIIIVGFIAGIIARLLAPGPNYPVGFILTIVLGIVGAILATFVGQAIGWYRPGESTGLIGAVIGAAVVLLVWHRLVVSRSLADPDAGGRRWL